MEFSLGRTGVLGVSRKGDRPVAPTWCPTYGGQQGVESDSTIRHIEVQDYYCRGLRGVP
jgi:hypothetical protein